MASEPLAPSETKTFAVPVSPLIPVTTTVTVTDAVQAGAFQVVPKIGGRPKVYDMAVGETRVVPGIYYGYTFQVTNTGASNLLVVTDV